MPSPVEPRPARAPLLAAGALGLLGLASASAETWDVRLTVLLLALASLAAALALRPALGPARLGGFLAATLLPLGLLLWAAAETAPLRVAADGQRLTIQVRAAQVDAAAPLADQALVAVQLQPERTNRSAWSLDGLPAPLADLLRPFYRGWRTGLVDLAVYDRDGRRVVGPLEVRAGWTHAETEVRAADGSRLQVRPGEDGWLELAEVAGPVVVEATLLRPNTGVAVRVVDRSGTGALAVYSPEFGELRLVGVTNGARADDLAGGFYRANKPAGPAAQTLLRELLRVWLWAWALVLAACGLALLVGRAGGEQGSQSGPGRSGVPERLRLPVVRLPWRPALGALVLATLGATASIAWWVLDGIPHVQDSVAYLFQARIFALGLVAAPAPPVPQAFEHEFVLVRDGLWFGKYPPGFPLVLALGVLAGAPWLVNPIAGALAVGGVALLGRRVFGPGVGLLAAALLLGSPFFLFLAGSMMSHTTSLLWAVLLLLAFERSEAGRAGPGRPAAAAFWPLLAGFAFGMLFITRQLTALGLAAPFLVAWLWAARRGGWGALGRPARAALGFLPPALLLLGFNRALTGSPLVNPFELWWEFDRVGFGPTVGMHGGHDLGRGLVNTYLNLSELLRHLWGWPHYLTLAPALVPFLVLRARRWDWLLLLSALGLFGAYVFYWAEGIMYGPRYYYEANAALALLTARGLAVLAELAAAAAALAAPRRGAAGAAGPSRSVSGDGRAPSERLSGAPAALGRAAVALLVLPLLVGNLAAYLPAQLDAHRGYNGVSGARLAAVRAAGIANAVVLVDEGPVSNWQAYGSVFPANDPLLRGAVVYARWLGPAVTAELRAAFPGRDFYLLEGTSLRRLEAP